MYVYTFKFVGLRKNAQNSEYLLQVNPPSVNKQCPLQLTSMWFQSCKYNFFSPSSAPHVLVDFVVFPPRHSRNVTDFWGWDTHEARLSCLDDVSGDIGGCSARRALKPKFYYPTQTMVTAGILPFRENSHSRAGNRTRDLMISRQRLWPLDHEAGRKYKYLRLDIL